jgi:phospholipid/cholesterol/gamma-HCH transport system ATP-binding protein
MITISGLHKRIGAQHILQGIDLHIGRGAVVAIVGPSGTGKSVLLKHVIGLLRPDAGDVTVDGVSVPGASRDVLYALRARMGYAFQDAALLDSLDVHDNLRLALPAHIDGDAAGVRIREALALVNLADGTLAKRPVELSGGMRKRVGVARAVINRPSVILYDEPTTGLDPANAAGMHALIRTISDDTGATCMVVTHDVRALDSFADRVVTLTEGRIAGDCAPDTRRLTWS